MLVSSTEQFVRRGGAVARVPSCCAWGRSDLRPQAQQQRRVHEVLMRRDQQRLACVRSHSEGLTFKRVLLRIAPQIHALSRTVVRVDMRGQSDLCEGWFRVDMRGHSDASE